MSEIENVPEKMSSLEIASITSTEHFNVLQKIDRLLENMDDEGKLNFQLTYYIDKSNRKSRCYEMNKTGSLVMIASYNVNFLTAVIERWQELEAKESVPSVPKLPHTKKEWIQFSLEQEEVIEKQQLQLSEQAPKIMAFENVIDNANTYTLDSVSDILNIGRTNLSKILEKKKWKTIKETNGTSSTRYAEENGYAKTVYEYIKINQKDIKTKRFVLKKKGLDKLIKEQQNGQEFN